MKNIGKILIYLLLLSIFSFKSVLAERLFIFNPEAKTSDFGPIKIKLEKLLSSEGLTTEVYLFANSEDFNIAVKHFKPDFAIVASYYFTSMVNTYNWKSILAGHKKGEKEYNKILIALNSIKEPLHLKAKSLATVFFGATSIPYIESQLPSGVSFGDIRIVSVSKDIDAIMALGFEQVQAAIVTKANFNKLKQINPDVVKNLYILQELKATEYPKLVMFPEAKNINKFINIFKKMEYTGDIESILRFFDITGFASES
ncbi:MAG: hypothetical protein HQK79_15085 [Desulfobacterales bacterium]|nr:hypothetical protein [Desulfobacterales bacterium]MBF0395715.1 hypothetical protein [Desulfobacterales bacterium]